MRTTTDFPASTRLARSVSSGPYSLRNASFVMDPGFLKSIDFSFTR
jgi:hypothetical protein